MPARPRNDIELGFRRRPMVRWLDPHQLLGTSARVLASGFSAAYLDSRELQALVPAEVIDRSSGTDMWFDYVSDLGDGWNSTYTVAWLLAQPSLELPESGSGRAHRTSQGSVLVMGGDEVYPVPTGSEYENRLLGPYRSAMPVPPESAMPDLVAIPGSHDWYDGLVNFSSIFCRHRVVGGRATRQTRSYFALRLPHRWWVWGIDLQFGDYLDEAQIGYFAETAAQHVEPGDRIVICMAKEVDSGRNSREVCSDRNVGYLEREVIAPAGGEVVLYLKSGRHYYCRYQGKTANVVTAGGGGAFLHPTHDLPLELDPPGDPDRGPFRRTAVYPTAAVSRRLRKRVWLLPAYNLPLAAVLGAIQVLIVFMLGMHLGHRHTNVGFADLWHDLWDSPTAFVLILLIVLSFVTMIRLAHDAEGLPRFVIGLAHSTFQFLGLAIVIVVSSRLATALVGRGIASLLVFLGVVWVVGGVGGMLGVSAYLWATNCFGFHANEAYAPLHHMDLKNFLRFHIDGEGALTIYPVAIDRVCRRWEFRPDDPGDASWLAPAEAPPAIRLIEPPVVIGSPAA